MLKTLFHQNYCFTIFDQSSNYRFGQKDLLKTLEVFSFVNSFNGTSEFSRHLFDQIHSLMLVKNRKTVILMKKGHQQEAPRKKEIKTKDLQRFPASWTLSSEPGQLDQICVNKI
jgi:hypothetical protein